MGTSAGVFGRVIENWYFWNFDNKFSSLKQVYLLSLDKILKKDVIKFEKRFNGF